MLKGITLVVGFFLGVAVSSVAVAADHGETVHLVSRIVGQEFLSETVRIGDLNGDGAPDMLFVQNLYGPRIITCLTATTIAGEILWQTGTSSKDNGRCYCDLPVQIYDWDRDGRNEVLYVRQANYVDSSVPDPRRVRERAERYEGDATMLVLDGRSGREECRFALPAPADDSYLLADLTGRGRREDLVVKDRYWNMWGVSHDGQVLWHYAGSVGHYPAIDVLQSVSRLASRLSGPEHSEAARRMRETLATLQSAEDLLRIGAYTAGGNPKLDQALQIEEAIRGFLRQRPEETNSLGETVQRLVHLLPK